MRDEFNKSYWAFIYLVREYPELYLNKFGKIIYVIASDKNGECCITKTAKALNINISDASVICKKMLANGHVNAIKKGNTKNLVFDKAIINNALKEILKNYQKDDEY